MSPKSRAKHWSVYILRCADGSLYTGIAIDVAARIVAHNEGRGAKYTRARLPVAVVWTRRLAATPARSLEARLKRLTRSQKESLLAGAPLRTLLAARRRKMKKRGA